MSAVIEVEGLGKQYRLAHGVEAGSPASGSGLMGLFRRTRGTSSQYENFWALRDVGFSVEEGEILGLIGRNGSGKSTLLKILSRITDPTTGEVVLRGRTASLLEVGTGFHAELTGRENVYFNGSILGMSRREINRKFTDIVEFSEVERFLDTPVKFYSSGMYVRLAFAVAAHLEPDILIVDEVLAVGDIQFQQKCLGRMNDVAGSGRTVVFVSHNMTAIEELCTTAIVLDRGRSSGKEDVRTAIDRYMQRRNSSEVTYPSGPVRRVGARQVDDRIEVYLDYLLPAPMSSPSLGFVISDQAGRPVTGGAPWVTGHPVTGPRSSGRLRVTVTEPRLRNGTYRLSVWFGDGGKSEDVFSDMHCISFDVVGMASNNRQSAATAGPVEPRCHWDVDERPEPFDMDAADAAVG